MTDDARATRPEEGAENVEVLREAVTLALYVSLSLLAVLIAVPSSVESGDATLALTVGVTALGLVFAHQIAFRISTRLVSHGRVGPLGDRLLRAQVAGGLVAAVIAVVPILLFPAHDLIAAELALLGFVCLVGYLAARSVPVGRARALGYVAGIVVVVGILLTIKSFAGH